MADDLFDAALNIEDDSYTEGYNLGHNDGSKAGLLEGRAFGLEKGFEKFLDLGRLHGRAEVWGARIPAIIPPRNTEESGTVSRELVAETQDAQETAVGSVVVVRRQVPMLAPSERLERRVRTLFALTEPGQVATVNEEDAVSEVDDRIKRAVSMAKVIERIVGEQGVQNVKDDVLPGSLAGVTGVKGIGRKGVEEF